MQFYYIIQISVIQSYNCYLLCVKFLQTSVTFLKHLSTIILRTFHDFLLQYYSWNSEYRETEALEWLIQRDHKIPSSHSY